MKIRQITLGKDAPESIVVEMTVAEAILITKYVGQLTPCTQTSTGIWDELTSSLFNRFWDDCVDDAAREDYR